MSFSEENVRIISFVLNGKKTRAVVDDKTTLLELLRDVFGLTGAKEGCGYGKCGTCSVIMNGREIRSCVTKAVKVDGAEITTIEGVGGGLSLDPIQEALIDGGAVQCGFCTPGIIMCLKALFDADPNVSDDGIRAALKGHLCRCTGYETIFKSALLARERIAGAGGK